MTANTCLRTKAKVREQMGQFFLGLGQRTVEVQQWCRTVLQAKADELGAATAKHVSMSPMALGLIQGAAPGRMPGVSKPPVPRAFLLGVLAQVNHVDTTLALV